MEHRILIIDPHSDIREDYIDKIRIINEDLSLGPKEISSHFFPKCFESITQTNDYLESEFEGHSNFEIILINYEEISDDEIKAMRRLRELSKDSELLFVSNQRLDLSEMLINEIPPFNKITYQHAPVDYLTLKQLLLSLSDKYTSEKIRDKILHRISNDFKTPITVILGFASLCKERGLNTNEINNNTNVIIKNANILNNLIDDLITSIKLESGVLGLNLQKINSNEFFQSLRAPIVRLINSSKKNITLYIRDTHEEELIKIDETYFRNCFIQIIENIVNEQLSGSISISYNCLSDIPLKNINIEVQGKYNKEAITNKAYLLSGHMGISETITQLHRGQLEVKETENSTIITLSLLQPFEV